MIVAAIIYGLLVFYLPGFAAVVFDELTNRPRGRRIVEYWVKIHFVGVIATVIGGTIMMHESLLGEEYVNSLFRSSDNYGAQFLRYLPTLIASIPIALILSLLWGVIFYNRIVVRFVKRKILKDPTYTEFAKDMPTFIKLNEIKFVSIWDKKYGEQITGKIERCEEEGEMITFLLSDAVIYNSVGEEKQKAKTHRLFRRKNDLLVAFTGDSPLPGGRLRIELKEK